LAWRGEHNSDAKKPRRENAVVCPNSFVETEEAIMPAWRDKPQAEQNFTKRRSVEQTAR